MNTMSLRRPAAPVCSAGHAGRGRTGAARRWLVGGALAMVLAGGLAAPAHAQRSGDRPRTPEQRAELERRFRARMDRMIQQRLGLDATEAKALREVTGGFDQRRRALGREEGMARRQVEELMASDVVDDERARALIERLVTLRSEEGALFAEEQTALLEVLTPSQVLELHDFRRELGQRIRALRNRDDGESRRRRPGGSEASSSHGAHWRGGNVDWAVGVGLIP